jgi:hypothetical protein
MSAWDIVGFILILSALVAVICLLHRSEKGTKNKWKLAAYNLLEEKKPDPKKVRETIKFLRIYGGRFRKDSEFTQLDLLLSDLLHEIEKPNKPDIKNSKTKK